VSSLSGTRLWAAVALDLAVYAGVFLLALILMPVVLIVGAVYLVVAGVRRLHARVSLERRARREQRPT
jgi:hypothetical protein